MKSARDLERATRGEGGDSAAFPTAEKGQEDHMRRYRTVIAGLALAIGLVGCAGQNPGETPPACAWAAVAEPGARIQAMVLGTAKFAVPEDAPAGYLLIGDAASIPAINSIIEVVPRHIPLEVYLEQQRPADALIPLATHPRLRLHRVPRTSTDSLAAAIEARDWSNWYTWATPESGSLRHLRSRLRHDLGFPKAEIHAQAYWVEGRAMGTRRDREAEAAAGPGVSPSRPVEKPEEETARAAPADARAREDSSRPTRPQTAADTPAAPRSTWRSNASTRLLAPMRSTFWIAGVIQALITVLQLLPYVLLVELARQLLADASSATLLSIGLAALLIMGVGVILEAAMTWWLHRVDARFEADIRRRLLTKLARLPLGWFTGRGSGQVKKLVQDDPLSLHYLLTHAIPDAVAAVVAPVAVLVYLFIVDWRLALLLLLPVLVYLVTMGLMVGGSGAKIRQHQEWTGVMTSSAEAFLEAQPVVRVFGGAAESEFRRKLARYLEFLNAWQRPFIGKKSLMDLATRPATFLWLLAGMGTLLIVHDRLDPINLLPFLILGTTFGARLLGISYGIGGINEGVLAARGIQNALEETELVEPAAPAAVGDPAGGLLEFEQVSFGYQPRLPVLQDITLRLEPGTVTALVGPSGAGKSTLASLAARFHDVTEGSIRIDGVDIRQMPNDVLYSHVGFVFQETQLLRDTVANNIALARPGASASLIEEAARDAQIHERILRLPRGYDSVIGEDAVLSGGERQRLTIARALLADTPILILDEATAFADPESEYQVQRAISRLTAHRTVLVIAHRLHTIMGADNIVVLSGGSIVERGRHESLLAREGRYFDLWTAGRGQK